MDILANLAGGFVTAFEPLNLALMVLGCFLGLMIGAIPGLGSVNGVGRHHDSEERVRGRLDECSLLGGVVAQVAGQVLGA